MCKLLRFPYVSNSSTHRTGTLDYTGVIRLQLSVDPKITLPNKEGELANPPILNFYTYAL